MALADTETAEIARPLEFEEFDALDKWVDELAQKKAPQAELEQVSRSLFVLDKDIRHTPGMSEEALAEADKRVVQLLFRLSDLSRDLVTEDLPAHDETTVELERADDAETEEAESPVNKLGLQRKNHDDSRETKNQLEVPNRDLVIEDLNTEEQVVEAEQVVAGLVQELTQGEVGEKAWRHWRKAKRAVRELAERVEGKGEEQQRRVASLLVELKSLQPELAETEPTPDLKKLDVVKSLDKRFKKLKNELESINDDAVLGQEDETTDLRLLEIERELREVFELSTSETPTLKRQRLLADIKDGLRQVDKLKYRLGLAEVPQAPLPRERSEERPATASTEVVGRGDTDIQSEETEMVSEASDSARPTLLPPEREFAPSVEEDEDLLEELAPSFEVEEAEVEASPTNESTDLRLETNSTERLRPGDEPTVVLEPPPMPVELREGKSLSPIAGPQEKPRKTSFVGRSVDSARRGLRYIFSLGKDRTTEFLRTQVKGELSPVERGERPLTKLEALGRMTAAVVDVGATTFGVKWIADAPRWVSQRHFVRRERDEINRAVQEVARDLKEPTVGYQERAKFILSRIDESRYLTPEKKQNLRQRLGEVVKRSLEEGKEIDGAFAQETGAILSDAIRARVSGTKVLKESLNGALMLMGGSAMRGGAYTALSLVERWQATSKDAAPEQSKWRIQRFIAEGFGEWKRKITGQEGRTRTERLANRAQALGVLLKTAGTFVEIPGTEISAEYMNKALSYFEQMVGDRLAEVAPLMNMLPEAQAASELPEEIPMPPELPELPELPEVMAPLPEASIVKADDGITQVLTRTIERDPRQYGYSGGEDDFSMHLFSKRKALELADKLGLRNAYLTEKAIDNLAILPEKNGDTLTIGFLDAATGNKIYANDLAERGFIEK